MDKPPVTTPNTSDTGVGGSYDLPFPELEDVANVPQDMKALAAMVDYWLSKKLSTTSAVDSVNDLQVVIPIVTAVPNGAPSTGNATTNYSTSTVVFVVI